MYRSRIEDLDAYSYDSDGESIESEDEMFLTGEVKLALYFLFHFLYSLGMRMQTGQFSNNLFKFDRQCY